MCGPSQSLLNLREKLREESLYPAYLEISQILASCWTSIGCILGWSSMGHFGHYQLDFKILMHSCCHWLNHKYLYLIGCIPWKLSVDEAHPTVSMMFNQNQSNTGQKSRHISIQPISRRKRFRLVSETLESSHFKVKGAKQAYLHQKLYGNPFSWTPIFQIALRSIIFKISTPTSCQNGNGINQNS